MKSEVLLALAVMGIPALAIGFIMKTVLNYRLRNRMIEKGYVEPKDQSVLSNKSEESELMPLKWGLIIFSAGLGLALLEYIPYGYESPFPFGFIAMCVAAGLFVYYIVLKNSKKNKSN